MTPVVEVGFVCGGDVAQVRQLEALPIDSLWTGGHIASRNPSPEALVSLARMSAVTERVKIGTSILLLPLYEPAIVAKQVADLDGATGGRVILGVGVGGEYPAEFRACHVPIEERGKRADEAIGLLREFWTAQPVNHDGPFFPVHDVRIHPAPRQPGGPPLVVAGRKRPAMRRAALLGDGWMPYLYSPRRYARSAETIRQVAHDAGRDLGGFGWYVFVFVNVNPDGDVARQQAASTLGGNYNQEFKELVDSVAAAGTMAEVKQKLISFVEAGARHFIFVPASGTADPSPIIHRLLEDVLPEVQRGGWRR